MNAIKYEKEIVYKKQNLNKFLLADTFWNRLCGYMFRKEPHYVGILFKPCSSIHTFFIKFEIDVLFIDKDKKVIKKIEALAPRKIIFHVKDSYYVLEGPKGKFQAVEVGDKFNEFDFL
jgi:Uncharacterized conserved protein